MRHRGAVPRELVGHDENAYLRPAVRGLFLCGDESQMPTLKNILPNKVAPDASDEVPGFAYDALMNGVQSLALNAE